MDVNDQGRSNIQYYKGIFKKFWKTPSNNTIIQTEDTKYLQNVEGVKVTKGCTPSEMNFLIPRRRERVTGFCEEILKGTPITVKLIQETRSKKFAVSEVFV
jgi:hypothetical protein